MSERDNGTADDVGTFGSDNAGGLNGTTGESDDTDNRGGGTFEPGKPIVIDPTAIAGSTAGSGGGSDTAGSGGAKRRRGRPPGSGAGSRKGSQKNTADIAGGLELVIYSSHQMLAALVRVPEFAIEQSEAKQLSIGIANVGRHYDMKINEKAVDWIFLIQTMAVVYGPRLAVLSQKSRENRAARQGQRPTRQASSQPQPPPKNDAGGTHFAEWKEPEGFDPEGSLGGSFVQ